LVILGITITIQGRVIMTILRDTLAAVAGKPGTDAHRITRYRAASVSRTAATNRQSHELLETQVGKSLRPPQLAASF
jgi:hypothetical protein